MTAARLRRAAEVLRGAAERATPGPWVAGRDPGIGHIVTAGNSWPAVVGNEEDDCETATYIATVDPTFGLAVAAWLDAEARFRICSCKSDDCPDQFMNAVANSILCGTE